MKEFSAPFKNDPSFTVINDQSGLIHTAEMLSGQKVIAVDVESDSMYHYREKVCLIQISTPDINILIDTLTVRDLTPLSPIFSSPDIRKVFHGADYDMRSLFRDFNLTVNQLFDTQIASRFLGVTQTGLSYSLENRFGIGLEKKYQKSDWSKRPLSGEMLKYAVQDTCYLIPLSEILEKELREKKRFSWFEEECELLSKVRPSISKDEPLYMKFKGASRLDQRSLAILHELLKWRDEQAIRKDRPPFKIIGNEQILTLINKKPVDIAGLEGLSMKQVQIYGESLLKRIRTALDIPEENLPSFPPTKRLKLNRTTLKKIDLLKKWREDRAGQTGLDPSLLCPNWLVQSIALVDPVSVESLKEVDEIRRWQTGLFEEKILYELNSISQE
jgi:ribonuclease D